MASRPDLRTSSHDPTWGETQIEANEISTPEIPRPHDSEIFEVAPLNPARYDSTLSPTESDGSQGINISSQALSFIPPAAHMHSDRFVAMAKWRGTVLATNGSTFTALLESALEDDVPKQAEIHLQDVPNNDRDLVVSGARFYWTIGYLDAESGNRARQSIIRFRRFPGWTDTEIEDAKRMAREYQHEHPSEPDIDTPEPA